MKSVKLLIVLLFIGYLSNAQMTSTADAKKIKETKLIIALKEYPKKADDDLKAFIDSSNESLKFAMKNYWKFNEIHDYMPLSEAKSFIKKNKGYSYITIDVGYSNSMKHSSGSGAYRYVSYAEKLSIYTPKLMTSVYLPYYQGTLSKPYAVYAAVLSNKILDHLYNEEFKNIMGWWPYIKKKGPEIINKTLLIPKDFISPKLSMDDIKLAYPYDLDICDLEKINKAILEQDPKYAIVYYIVQPAGGRYAHRLYVSNAEDGDIYGVADGSKIAIDLGIFGTVGGGQNKKYLINAKELKQISKIVK